MSETCGKKKQLKRQSVEWNSFKSFFLVSRVSSAAWLKKSCTRSSCACRVANAMSPVVTARRAKRAGITNACPSAWHCKVRVSAYFNPEALDRMVNDIDLFLKWQFQTMSHYVAMSLVLQNWLVSRVIFFRRKCISFWFCMKSFLIGRVCSFRVEVNKTIRPASDG